jgi:hypothetical protein
MLQDLLTTQLTLLQKLGYEDVIQLVIIDMSLIKPLFMFLQLNLTGPLPLILKVAEMELIIFMCKQEIARL